MNNNLLGDNLAASHTIFWTCQLAPADSTGRPLYTHRKLGSRMRNERIPHELMDASRGVGKFIYGALCRLGHTKGSLVPGTTAEGNGKNIGQRASPGPR